MNKLAVKKHILEQLAHGQPIQLILDPQPPMIEIEEWDHVTEQDVIKEVPDPDWVKPDLPDWNIVIQWLKDDESFRKDWEMAKRYGAEYLADEMVTLKTKVLRAPKEHVPAYKAAMDMLKTAAMWRDPKYSDRIIQDVNKPNVPTDPVAVLARIKQIQEELGLNLVTTGIAPADVVDVESRFVTSELPKHGMTDKKRAAVENNLAKARAARAAKRKARDADASTKTRKT